MIVRLPELQAGGGVWRLPLSPPASADLLSVLVADDLQSRRDVLTAMLADEPPLALWLACRRGSSQPVDLTELAAWFADDPLGKLHWRSAEVQRGSITDRDQRVRWARLAATSVICARIAVSEVEPGGPSGATQLLALLSGAVRWLASSGTRISWEDCQAGATCLPPWLVAALGEVKAAGEGRSGPAKVVAASRPRSQQGHATERKRIRRRWLQAGWDRCGEVLPALADRLRRCQQLEGEFARTLEQEKLASLRELAYGASHEINNPLANISTRAQTLLRGETDPERSQMLAVINSQAFRAHEMISDMMLFANPPEMQPADVSVRELIADVLAEFSGTAGEQQTEIGAAVQDESLVVVADREHLAAALTALVRNSLEATVSGGRIDVSAGLRGADARHSVLEIAVSDTGPGIPPEVRRHLFDPFYSGREAGRGLGFGLSKCWRVVTLHGGRIEVGQNDQGGAVFRMLLPRWRRPNGNDESWKSIPTAG